MSGYSRRNPVKTNRANILWLVVFILFSTTLVVQMGWYWVGTIIGAYLMLAFASILLRGRPDDDNN